MCGITGILLNRNGNQTLLARTTVAVQALHRRGPDASGVKKYPNAAFGHARLAVIDPTEAAVQPFLSEDQRYLLVFNGEIYNYQELRGVLIKKGQKFKTNSDTEVLLYWLINFGIEGVKSLNGFFSFAFYDSKQSITYLVRDRFGIKPLYIFESNAGLIFGSEMKAVYAYDLEKNINQDALALFFKFNYQPTHLSVIEYARQLSPGSFVKVSAGKIVEEELYYDLPIVMGKSIDSYQTAQHKVRELLQKSVAKRMVSDVPLGAFLSGGIDSSIITALAVGLKPELQTFSVGFKDEKIFDETHYAQLVADRYQTNHTVIELSNDDLFEELGDFLDYNCDPFADSSALAVNLLCKHTRSKLTVALSGDGADELFSGYNKHMAEFVARQKGVKHGLIKSMAPLYGLLPQSRNSKLGNLGRQLDKFVKGTKLSANDRYWDWSGWKDDREVELLLKRKVDMNAIRSTHQQQFNNDQDLNEVLRADFKQVLPGDMLTKVDRYSMANSLEVRVPFLDHELVDYVFSLPANFKIQKGIKKRLLQDAFRADLPAELYRRPKHGFEVPLLKWFKGPMWDKINTSYLEHAFIKEQGLFDYQSIKTLLAKIQSNQPGDAVAQIWALIVFQHWYKKYYSA